MNPFEPALALALDLVGVFAFAVSGALVAVRRGLDLVGVLVLAWLMLGRFALGPRRMSRSQLDRTLLIWALPLLIAPPMYSKDVYSYLAQSQIARLGLDPYRVGPAPGLGLDHVFTLSVPSLWRDTPAPYGPLFVLFAGVAAAVGHSLVGTVAPTGTTGQRRPAKGRAR